MIRIYGASDDLIEIEGDITEEFNFYGDDDEERFLAFSDGTLLRVVFDSDSIWRLTPLFNGHARMTHIICSVDDDNSYSDQVHLFDDGLDEGIHWVTYGVRYEKRRR